MAALPDWASSKFDRSSAKQNAGSPSPEFARAVYRETKGATPALRELVKEYKSKKESGAIRTSSTLGEPTKR